AASSWVRLQTPHPKTATCSTTSSSPSTRQATLALSTCTTTTANESSAARALGSCSQPRTRQSPTSCRNLCSSGSDLPWPGNNCNPNCTLFDQGVLRGRASRHSARALSQLVAASAASAAGTISSGCTEPSYRTPADDTMCATASHNT